MRFVWIAALSLVAAASAQDRATFKPSSLQGNWFASPASMPANCEGDGTFIAFSVGTKLVSATVTQRTGATYSAATTTNFAFAEPVETAPARIGVFLAGGNGVEIGLALMNTMQLEWVPAGADKTYPTTAIYLRKC